MDYMRSPIGAQNSENKIKMKVYNKRFSPSKENPSFKGMPVLTNGIFRLLDSNKFIGANTVDIVSMVIPRTYVDSKRNPDAKSETLFRESQSVIVHSTIGIMGILAALAIKSPLKRKYGIDFEKINANSNSIDAFSHAFHKAFQKHGNNKEKIIESYLDEVLSNSKGLDGKEWNSIDKKIKEAVIKNLKEKIFDSNINSIDQKSQRKLEKLLINEFKSKNNIEIAIDGSPKIKTNISLVIKDSVTLGKTFLKDKVLPTFENLAKSSDNIVVKELKKYTGRKTLLGLLASGLLGFSFQSINRNLTKKRTGQEGFVGYSDFGVNNTPSKPKVDKSDKFKALKTLAVLGMGLLSVKSIGGKLKDIPKKIQFTSLMPTLNQIKVVYAATIIGRIIASSDKNELRETVTRDYLGFVNWLILGDVVSKKVAKFADKKLINYDKKQGSWLSNAAMKSHDEIIYASKEVAGKTHMNFKEIMKNMSKETLQKLGVTNMSLLIGYVSSGLALGLFIPWLNKTITANKREKELLLAKNKTQYASNIHFRNGNIMADKTKHLFSEFVKN